MPGKSSPRSRTIHRSSSAFSARAISESIFSLSDEGSHGNSYIILLRDGGTGLHSLPPVAVAEDDVDVLQEVDVAEDVAADGDDVRVFAFAHRADLI